MKEKLWKYHISIIEIYILGRHTFLQHSLNENVKFLMNKELYPDLKSHFIIRSVSTKISFHKMLKNLRCDHTILITNSETCSRNNINWGTTLTSAQLHSKAKEGYLSLVLLVYAFGRKITVASSQTRVPLCGEIFSFMDTQTSSSLGSRSAR